MPAILRLVSGVLMFQRQVAMDLVNIYGDINALLDFCLQENSYTQVVNNDSRDSTDINVQPPDKTEHYDPQLVKLWVQNQIKQRIAEQELPEMIESFLFDHWSELLAGIFYQYSMDSLEWERAIQVVDDLAECATLRDDKQSRLQQVWQFPGLVYRLKAGMKVIALPLSIQARFISDLKVFHSQLVDQNQNIKNN